MTANSATEMDISSEAELALRDLVLDAQRTLRPEARRSYFDRAGTFWQVVGVRDSADGPLLTAQSRDSELTIGPVPSDWLDLTDDKLAELSAVSPEKANIEKSVARRRAWIESLNTTLREVEVGAIDERLARHRIVGICVQAQLFHLLTSHRVAHPTYNYLRPYEYSSLPWDRAEQTAASEEFGWRVLGFDVGYPIGIPASVLTANADWVRYYAGRGFNILTFKTVRTEKRLPHQPPNWLFVDGADSPIGPSEIRPDLSVRASADVWPATPHRFSMVNSFGVPSVPPRVWMEELEKSVRMLGAGRLLIVSVIGDERLGSFDATVADYVKAAKMACESGALAIELNLSCPNTIQDGKVKEDMIGSDPDAAAAVSRAVRDAVGTSVKLIVKLNYMSGPQLDRVFSSTHKFLDGVSGINTLQVRVTDDGGDAFPGRPKAGLSGVAIKELGLDFARSAVRIRDTLGRSAEDFDVIAMGGVMDANDVEAYRSIGVSAVQSATAAFFNAELAREVVARYRAARRDEWSDRVEEMALDVLSSGAKPLNDLMQSLAGVLQPSSFETASRLRKVLSDLETKGVLTSAYSNGRLVFELRREAQVVAARA